MSTKSSFIKNTDLPIVLVGDNFQPNTPQVNGDLNPAHELLNVTVGGNVADQSDPILNLDAKAFQRDALVRIARKEGITLNEARQLVLEEQRNRVLSGIAADMEADEYFAEEIVGYMTVTPRIVRKVIHRQNKPTRSKKARKVKDRVEKLSKQSRRAKWESFENADIEAYVNAAAAMGMKVALVTFKFPKVKDWMKLYAPTVAGLKGKDGTLQKTLRTIGAKFEVPGFGKAWHGFWVIENTTMGIKRPHFHLVMMVPDGWGEDFIRNTWIKKAGLPTDLAANDTVHVSYADDDDDRTPVQQFRDASRYLSRNKFEQERVNAEWLDAGESIGDMWDVRGFKQLPSEKVAIRRKHVEPVREIMTEVTSRPAVNVDEATGEVTANPYARWVSGATFGNREIMDDTTGVVEAFIAAGILTPVSEAVADLN